MVQQIDREIHQRFKRRNREEQYEESGYAIFMMILNTSGIAETVTRGKPKKTAIRRESALSEDRAMAAIFDRDDTLRNEFVYGVSSTGIFCRCDCPSRRPSRKNIVLFKGPKEALQAGFRPCFRCRPEETFGSQKHLVNSVLDSLNMGHSNLNELAEEHGLSSAHLQKIFKREVGLSPAEYSRKRKMNLFREELKQGSSILDAAADAGFPSLRGPYEQSVASLGMRPSQAQKKGLGLRIAYTVQNTSLG
ncbi:MAG: methylphosphotriester-DNA--protein-cysteine methyltransferase family protein, partial [Leptospiraceae bacterium]|nr:methylphosphotriester-DNA--protein-cysteine methyltransferase family protein [Leptospiraceae bacterium]